MRNPILSTPKATLIYFAIFIIMATITFLVMSNIVTVNTTHLAADIYIQNLLFAVLLIGIWYPINYMNIENQSVFSLVLNYVLTYLIFATIWIGLSNLLLNLFISDIAQSNYFKSALPFKIVISFLGFFIFILVVNFIKYYNSYIEKKEIENQLYATLKEAELTQLRNQLNPHFIFNSLNSISSLTILDPVKAQEMVIKLSDFLRYTVSFGQNQNNTLRQELQMCEAYLDIEKVRFGDKINFKINAHPDTLNIKLPTLLLQPIFENAVKHGVHGSLNTEAIIFESYMIDDRLEIKLQNTFDDTQAPKIGTQSGIKNIKSRLALNYNHTAYFKTETIENTFIVTLNMPSKI